MIDLIITDEELAEDKRAFGYFHTLRKNNSPRRVRQAAWRVCENIRWKWHARYARMHPIAPKNRWRDFNNTAPDGWTYPGLRSLEPAEVEELFPGALAAFATQCDDLGTTRFVLDEGFRGCSTKLRLSVRQTPPETRGSCTTWMPEVSVWRRYSKGIRTRPTQFENEGIVYPLPRPPQLG